MFDNIQWGLLDLNGLGPSGPPWTQVAWAPEDRALLGWALMGRPALTGQARVSPALMGRAPMGPRGPGPNGP